MNTSRIARLLLALTTVLILAAGCMSSTTLVSSWHDDSYRSGTLRKPMVLAVASRPIVRSKLEDRLTLELRSLGIDAMQSYKLFPDTTGLTAAAITAKLRDTDRDAVLVTHLVDVKKEIVVVPAQSGYYGDYPGYYGRFGPYYSHSYTMVTSPGYTYEAKTYVLETNLYDARTEKLVWAVVTNSEEPSSLDSAIDDFAAVVVKDIEKNRLF